MKLYIFRAVRLSIIRSLYAVHSAMVYVIQVCRQLSSRTRMELSIIRSLYAVHSAMVYVIQVCRQLSSRIRMELQFHPRPVRKLSTNLYNIYHC
jgi:hypothetical protein